MTDSVYSPSRAFADKTLKRMGIETTYYDPTIGAGIDALMRPEHQGGVHRISGLARRSKCRTFLRSPRWRMRRGACVILDNTWATPLFFSPHAHGVDMAVEAGTKYLSGHADLLLGLVSANEAWFERLHRTRPPDGDPARRPRTCFSRFAACAPWILRLREAERQGLALAQWLERPARGPARHPPRPARSSGPRALEARLHRLVGPLFDRAEAGCRRPRVAAFLDGLELFGIGYSWGGYESLAIPFDCTATRTATRFDPGGPTVRFSVGLEDIEDLKADLDRGFARLRETV